MLVYGFKKKRINMKIVIINKNDLNIMSNWSAEVVCNDAFTDFLAIAQGLTIPELRDLTIQKASHIVGNEFPFKAAFDKEKTLLGQIRGTTMWSSFDEIKTFLLRKQTTREQQARALFCVLVLFKSVTKNKEEITAYIEEELLKAQMFKTQLNSIIQLTQNGSLII
jgi:hypothetical protein